MTTPPHEALGPSAEEILNTRGEVIMLRFDVNPLLERSIGLDWQRTFAELSDAEGAKVVRDASHWTCREADPKSQFGLIAVDGQKLIAAVPAFWGLYSGALRDLMQQALPEGDPPMKTYDGPEAACLELYRQVPPENAFGPPGTNYRMEAHIDQRNTAILGVEAPASVTSGRLVVASNPDAIGVEQIAQDATYIQHQSGMLLCFPKGKKFPHYTEPIASGEHRLIFSINYPVIGETPEQAAELTTYNHGFENAYE